MVLAAATFLALAGSAAAQFPGMGMPMGGMGGMMPQMGGMPQMGMPPQMGGMMGGMPQMPQMGGGAPPPGMGMGMGMGFPQMGGGMGGGMLPGMPNMFGGFGAPPAAPKIGAPQQQKQQPPVMPQSAPAATARATATAAAPATGMPIKDMAKWAEMMGMPKMSDDDMKKIADMQQGMLSKLRNLKEEDLSSMRADQNSLAEEMDRVMKNPTPDEVANFQSKQESLMGTWASKLNLPKVTPQEHDMMRDQLNKMFNTLKTMPANELEALRAKHEEIKKMALAHASKSN